MPDQIIAGLIERFLNGTITSVEKELLAKWILDERNENELLSMMEQSWHDFTPGQTIRIEKADQLLESIFGRLNEATLTQPANESLMSPVNESPAPIQPETIPVRRIGWSGRGRSYKLAAAVLFFTILTSAGFYFLLKPSGLKPSPIILASKDVPAPAASNATLTLSDGSTIVLDSAGKGNIATQRKTAIMQLGDGDIAYQANGNKANGSTANGSTDYAEYNTLTVPRGSRIAQLTLSDGTRVWLNAGSSIHYPVAFAGANRPVSVTGESYFEVARDAMHPFLVSKGSCTVKVLGTHFNVNTYEEEGDIKVTLLEGSVVVSSGSGNSPLLPGQMATIDARQQIGVLKNADMERVMAWKNGLFNFAGADIRTVMRELSRWYGLELVFKDVPNEKYHVEISRNTPLSKVLEIIEMTGGVHFNIKGNKVTVMK